MSETVVKYRASIADFVNGDFIVKTADGVKVIIKLGPAQIFSAQRGLDKFINEYEPKEG